MGIFLAFVTGATFKIIFFTFLREPELFLSGIYSSGRIFSRKEPNFMSSKGSLAENITFPTP